MSEKVDIETMKARSEILFAPRAEYGSFEEKLAAITEVAMWVPDLFVRIAELEGALRGVVEKYNRAPVAHDHAVCDCFTSAAKVAYAVLGEKWDHPPEAHD